METDSFSARMAETCPTGMKTSICDNLRLKSGDSSPMLSTLHSLLSTESTLCSALNANSRDNFKYVWLKLRIWELCGALLVVHQLANEPFKIRCGVIFDLYFSFP